MKEMVKMKLLIHMMSWCLGANIFIMGFVDVFLSFGLQSPNMKGRGTRKTILIYRMVASEIVQRLTVIKRIRGM